MQKVAALAVVLLFLVQAGLPFLNTAVAAIPMSTGTTQVPGKPLPPGTVSYQNTWNQTLTTTCPVATHTDQPLVSIPQSSTIKVVIPETLFMNKVAGANISHTYVIYTNGTFAASDDRGNSFAWNGIVGLPPGMATTTLRANATLAYQNTIVVAAGGFVANVTIAYSVRHQFCQPAGLKVTIFGVVAWPNGSGVLSLAFNKKEIKLEQNRAWFGNKSGISLGFDWSDSVQYGAAYSHSSLGWNVGGTFTIDPVTVATAGGDATTDSFQGQVMYANGRYWLFYFDGTNEGWRTSTDSLAWSAETTIATSGCLNCSVGRFDFFLSGTTLYYAISGDSCYPGCGGKVYYRHGTLNSDGSIAWSTETLMTLQLLGTAAYPSISLDSNGNLWIAANSYNGGNVYLEAWECTTPSSCSWSSKLLFNTGTNANAFPMLVPLTSGKLALVWWQNDVLNGLTYSGSTWSSRAQTTYSDYWRGRGSCVAISDTLECAMADMGDMLIAYLSMPYNNNSPYWTAETAVATSCSESYGQSASISTDGISKLAIAYVCGDAYVHYLTSANAGSTWTATTALGTGPNSEYVTMPYSFSNLFDATWTSGTSSPNNVNFFALPFSIPIAATSKNSWSRPGVSPYESYFANLNEYVSPGNGLLAVEQGDLVLPGRGMDLGVANVYSTPYAFKGTTPYQYDNYTLSNLGYGWSLNLPWMGTNYLHLTDGQAYPYNWVGSNFTLHGATDFSLIHNGDGTYTLTDRSGTTTKFNSNEQLTSITDHTGNNTVSFSYGTNGYISQISDTVARIVTLSYNANNQLSSVSSGGRSWTYGYTSGKLTSVTDPLQRVTTYQYNTGINSWLLSAILYPTGAETVYSYGHAAVGTEVTTYYVNLRNIYSSSSPQVMSQTDSIAYKILNGNVVSSNETISDGTKIQGYQNITFSASRNDMKLYSWNGTKFLMKITETNYDALGRTNSTRTEPSFTYGLAGYWPLDEGSGTTTQDLSGNGNSGTLVNSPTWQTGANCVYGSCIGFAQASSQYVSISSSSSLKSSSFTFSAWVYPQSGSQLYEGLVEQLLTGGGGTDDQRILISDSANTILVQDKLNTHNLFSTGTVTRNAWNLVTVTYDGTTTRIYLNGRLDSSSTSLTFVSTGGNPLLVGTGAKSASTYFMNGRLDDVRVYRRALSPNEISGLYSATSATLAVSAYTSSTFDNWGNAISSRNDVGQQTWFSYANTNSQNTFGTTGFSNSFYANAISSSIHSALLGEVQWQNGANTVPIESYYKYDKSANLLEEKQLLNAGWVYTDYTYDRYGNQITVSDALGRVTHYHYSSTYQYAYLTLTSNLVNSVNITTSNVYNSTNGELVSHTDGNGFTTSYKYDNIGRTLSITYPAVGGVHGITKYAYNDQNSTLTSTDADGNVAKSYFDGLARLTGVHNYNGSVLYSTETYTYNWCNQVGTDTKPTGSVYAYYYDYDCRLTKTTNPDRSNQTTFYDDVNNIQIVTNERGFKTSYGYDWSGNLLWVEQYNSSSNFFKTSYVYNLDGTLQSVTDPNNKVTSYTYDNLNRQIKTTFPDNSHQYASYDKVGNVLGRVDPKGNIINYTYDALNRLTNVLYPNSTQVAYTYDNNGNRLSMVYLASSVYYTYDARNWVTNETDVIAGTKYTTLYSYDQVGNVLSMTYPDMTVVSYTYDCRNRVRKVGAYATFTYNKDDTINKITYGNGEVTSYTYDSMSRPKTITTVYGPSTRLSLSYTYDATGNVVALNTETYKYDGLNRLNYTSGGTGGWPVTTFTYDGAGNVLTKTVNGVKTTYTYNSYNRLASAGTVTFTYDGNGNTKTKVNGTTWTYSYDYENRLTKVQSGSTTVSQDTYNGEGNLIKTVEGSTQVFVYQGNNRIYAKNTGPVGKAADYYYASGLLVASVNGSTSYYHEDALGSVRLVSSGTVGTLFTSNYRPYGTSWKVTGTMISPFAYTGKPKDSVTGLYYYGARFYDPTIGRFVTEDTNKGTGIDPLSQNRYAYAEDNPLRFVDPSGHMIITTGGGATGGSGKSGWVPAPVVTTVTVIVTVIVTVTVTATTTITTTSAQTSSGVQKQQVSLSPPASAPSSAASSQPGNPLGAALATATVGILSFAAGVATYGLTVAAFPTFGATAYLAVIMGGVTVAGAGAFLSMLSYDYSAGGNATPEGAFAAGGNGYITTGLKVFVNWLSTVLP